MTNLLHRQTLSEKRKIDYARKKGEKIANHSKVNYSEAAGCRAVIYNYGCENKVQIVNVF